MSLTRRALLRGAATAAATAAVPVLAACGESEVVTREVIKEVEVERVVTVTVTQPTSESEPLVIYSGRSESLVDPIIQQFRSVSGLDVQVKYAGTPALAATLLEEGDASPADVFFAQDPGGLGAIESLLSPLPDALLSRVPTWARSPQGLWAGISGRARVVVYNTDRLSPADLPDDLWGFTDPSWRGRLGWPPTNASFQTMVTGMRAVWGEDRTREWLDAMHANEIGIYPKNTPIVAATGAGEIDGGFVNHYYLHRFLAEEGESFAARNYHLPGGGPGSLVMVAGAGILGTAANRPAAEQFVDFLLSTVGQQYFASTTHEYPLVEGVKASRILTPLADVNKPAIALSDLADLQGTQAMLREAGILP